MVSNISNGIETNTLPQQDIRMQASDQVKKEQEDFQNLIDQKVRSAQEIEKDKTIEELKNTTSKVEEVQGVSKSTEGTQDIQPQSTQSVSNGTKIPQNTQNSMTEMKNNEAKEGAKTLADVKNLGDKNNLEVRDMKLETSAQNVQKNTADSTQIGKLANNGEMQKEAKTDHMSTQALLAQKSAQGSLKAAALATATTDPLAQALREVTTKDLVVRKMNKIGSIEYKREKGGEKIAVIERGAGLPKNITEANIRNAKRDEAYREVFEKFGVKDDSQIQDLKHDKKKV